MHDDDVLERVAKQLGHPAATVLASESPRDRQFIGEALVVAAALLLLKKYLDGFVEGLGIKKLGEKHAELLMGSIKQARELLEAQSAALTKNLDEYIRSLDSWRENSEARARGEKSVRDTLMERGLPLEEAQEIARSMSKEIFYDR